MAKRPIVLRIGEDIKYNHDFYNDVFTKHFDVVANEEPDRATFIQALKDKKYISSITHYNFNSLRRLDMASSRPFTAPISRQVVRWASGMTS